LIDKTEHMITRSDFIPLPFTPDLMQAGILFACRELAFGRIQESGSQEQLRQLVGDIAVELAFRHYLDELRLRFKTHEDRPVSLPGKGEVILGGRGCHLVNRLVDPHTSSRMDADLGPYLRSSVGLPPSELSSDRLADHDLLVFTFIKLRKSNPQAASPGFLLYRFPASWSNLSLPPSIQSRQGIQVELGGRGAGGEALNEVLHLLPGEAASSSRIFRSLAYLSIQRPVPKYLFVSLPGRKPLQIEPGQWQNLWLEVGEILLAGYIPVGEFRRHARRAKMSLGELYALQPLFDSIKTSKKP
jgi:hypothetical protein